MIDNIKADIFVDITGESCPVPLIWMRRALLKATPGQIIEIVGTKKEEESRRDILIAIENLHQEIIANYDEDKKWHLLIKKS